MNKKILIVLGTLVVLGIGAGVFAAMYPWGEKNIVVSPIPTETSTWTLNPPTISIVSVSVLSPSDGTPKSLVIGDTATIKWRSQGVEKVDIGYKREGSGAEFISIATAIPTELGNYSWTIPSSALPAEFVKGQLKFIVAKSPNQCGAGDCGVSDTSDEFSIVRNGSTDSWQTYRNEKYGFEVKIPNAWPEFNVRERSVDEAAVAGGIKLLEFGFLTNSTKWPTENGFAYIWGLLVMTRDQYNKYSDPRDGSKPEIFKQNENYIFAISRSNGGYPEDLENQKSGVVFSTFKFTK